MKTILSLLATITLASHAAFAAAGWDDDYNKAVATSKTEKKLVLLDFTGSDWCGWCKKLDADVFSKPDFKAFAKENLVLVEVDFPQGKKLSKKVQKQNAELKAKYKASGFPTLVLIDAEGKEIHRIGGYKADTLDELKKAVEQNKAK